MDGVISAAELAGYYELRPGRVPLRLYKRTSVGVAEADFDAAVVQPQCWKIELDRNQQLQLLGSQFSETVVEWCVWKTTQLRVPDENDVLQETGGTRWRVKKVMVTVLDTLYSCICVKEWVSA